MAKRRDDGGAARRGADTRARRRAPLYYAWANSYAEAKARETGRLMTPAEVDADPAFRAAVDRVIKSGRRASTSPDGRLSRALTTLGLRRPGWAHEVGDSDEEMVSRWHRRRVSQARRALERGAEREREAARRGPARERKRPAKGKTPARKGKTPAPKRSARKSAPARKPAKKSAARKRGAAHKKVKPRARSLRKK